MKKNRYALKECDDCGNDMRRMWRWKGKRLCYLCFSKCSRKLPVVGVSNRQTMEEALSKVRRVGLRFDEKRNRGHGFVTLPQVLIDHKIRIVLADD